MKKLKGFSNESELSGGGLPHSEMDPPFKVSLPYWIISVIIIIILLSSSTSKGQQLHEADGTNLLLMNIIDTLDSLSLQLKEHEATMEAKLEEKVGHLEAKIELLVEEKVGNLEAKFELLVEEKVGNLEAKIELLVEEKVGNLEAKIELLVEGQQQLGNSLQQCSTREQIFGFQDLLATDECDEATHNCSDMATCTDSRIQYKCTCFPGYFGDGFTCEDVDECSENKEACSSNEQCLNNPGNYSCICREGYEREGDSCQDVDECSENKEACSSNEQCLNNPGSYTCICPEMYKKEGDICQAPVCESPSVFHPSLGCLKAIQELTDSDGAKAKCQALGMRLAEGIRKMHLESLVQHFKPNTTDWWYWVGLQNGRWLTSGEEVSGEDWRKGDPDGGTQECGGVDLFPPVTGLGDYTCSSPRMYVLCQSLP